MISLLPVNNKDPMISTNSSVFFYEKQPLYALNGIVLSDEDEYCVGYSTIHWAIIELPSPRGTESLEVGKIKFSHTV